MSYKFSSEERKGLTLDELKDYTSRCFSGLEKLRSYVRSFLEFTDELMEPLMVSGDERLAEVGKAHESYKSALLDLYKKIDVSTHELKETLDSLQKTNPEEAKNRIAKSYQTLIGSSAGLIGALDPAKVKILHFYGKIAEKIGKLKTFNKYIADIREFVYKRYIPDQAK